MDILEEDQNHRQVVSTSRNQSDTNGSTENQDNNNEQIRLLKNEIETLHSLVRSQDIKLSELQDVRDEQDKKLAELQLMRDEEVAELSAQQSSQQKKIEFLQSHILRILPIQKKVENEPLMENDELLERWSNDFLEGPEKAPPQQQMALDSTDTFLQSTMSHDDKEDASERREKKPFETIDCERSHIADDKNDITDTEEEKGDGQHAIEKLEVPKSTYSFLLFMRYEIKYFFKTALIGMTVFVIQMLAIILMIYNSMDHHHSFNPFDFPPNVPTSTRLAGFLALIIMVASDDDAIKAVLAWYDGYYGNVYEGEVAQYCNVTNWRLSVYTRGIQGITNILAAFILVMESVTVIDLMLNFTALQFLSYLDDTVFYLSTQGFLGKENKKFADEIDECTYRVRNKNRLRDKLPLILFVAFYLPLLIGFFYITARQYEGEYSCQKLFVQFDDAVQRRLPGLSGHYKYYNDEGTIVYRLDAEERIGTARIQFCSSKSMWTLTIGPSDATDHCYDWIVRSSRSRVFQFDVTAAIRSEWFVRNDEKKEIVMEDFRMFCADCNVFNFCGPQGECHDESDTCICNDGWYGLRCDFLEPCLDLEIGTPNSNFPGFRQWSREYTRLASTKNNDESGFVTVYEHPVYYGQTSPDVFDIILFTGKRWIVTSSVMLDDLEGHVTRERLVSYLENDFHSYWSNFSFLLVSDGVGIDSSSDVVSPDGLVWYQYDDHMDIIQSIDITLLCIVCNNSTNPCFHEGVCTSDNRCDCTVNGATGALCHIPPIQNGFCDTAFNTPYFNFDGGDCCQGSCISDEFTCGWDKLDAKYISYCDCADLNHVCPEGIESCWLEIGDHILGDVDYAGSGRSLALSDDGTILAIGEPGNDQVRLFDNDGSKWNQLGEALKGEQGSSFGNTIALAGDGRVVAVGAPNFAPPNLPVGTNSEIIMQGQISIFEMTDYFWVKVDEIAIDTLAESAGLAATSSLNGRLGSSLAMSQDGRLIVFGIERTSIFRGGVFGFERNETTRSYFQSNAFSLDDSYLWEVGYTYWTRSISVSKSAHMLAFDAIDEGTSEVFVAKYECENDGNFPCQYMLLGASIQGRNGILSGNGQAVVVSSEDASPTCQVYQWDEDESFGNWTERGYPLAGTALALSSDGLTLAVERNDSSVHSFYWNGSHWLNEGHIMGGSEVAIVLSGGQSGVDISMAVGLPSDSFARGKTSVYKLLHSGQDSASKCEAGNLMIDIGIFTDNRPNETIWEIRDFFTQEILIRGGPYSEDSHSGQFMSHTVQMPSDTACAEFSIYDLGGDGICCEHGLGSYSLSFGNTVEKIGGNFEWFDKHLFGSLCRRTCGEGESLLSVEVKTDLYANETTWMLLEQNEGVVGRGGPFEINLHEYEKETCIASSGCYNFTVFDSYGDGMCCKDGIGGYAVRLDGDVIGSGDIYEYSESVIFGQCSSIASETFAFERYSSLSIKKTRNSTLPLESEWFLYEIGTENVTRGNQSVQITLDKHECYMFEAFKYEQNGVSDPVGYSLYVNGELFASGDSFVSGDYRMIGSCGHVATTISVPAGNIITCTDDASNFCAAPKSCANFGMDLEPAGENVFGIAFLDGTWATSGAYSLQFESDCDVVCSGFCKPVVPVPLSCTDDEIALRLQIASSFDLDWNLGNHDGEILHEGRLDQISHRVINERICIAVHVCTILTIEGEGEYLLYIGGEYLTSGSTSDNYAVENVCPELARTTNSVADLRGNETISSTPSNNWCLSASSLTLSGAPVQGSTQNATVDAVIRCGETRGSVSAGVWYHVVGTGKELVADSCGSEFNTQISIFRGSCDSLSCVAGNDNYCGVGGKHSRVAWNAVDGADYFLLIHGFGFESGSYVLQVMKSTPPMNDFCGDAIALSLDSSHVSVSGFFDLATIDRVPECYEERVSSNTSKTGVWYSVQGTGGTLIASACESNVETRISVFSGSCEALACVASQESEYGEAEQCILRDRVDWRSRKGTIYLIFVSSNEEESIGSYSVDLGISSVENDACADATRLAMNDIIYSSTTWASVETTEFSCGGDINSYFHGPAVWYSVVGTGNPIQANTCNSTLFDTQIAIFTGECNSLVCVAGNDDYCDYQSAVTWPSVMSNVYYILVQGWTPGSFGEFSLEVFEDV